MERHFTLPIAFAAAAHGALLFGFNYPPHVPVVPPKEKAPAIWITPPPVELDVPEIRDTSDRDAPKPDITPTITRSEERLAIAKVDDFRIEPQPLQPFTPGDNITVIPRDVGIIAKASPGGSVIPTHLLDKAPSTRVQPSPVYPHEGRANGLSGEVVVEFVVDENGRVLDPQIVKSSDRMFEEPTLRAVSKWIFEPGRLHGKVVRFRMMAPVVYNLNE